MPNDDLNLLREYARNNSEEAFAALATRDVNADTSSFWSALPARESTR